MLPRRVAWLLACLLPLACQREQPSPPPRAAAVVTMGDQGGSPMAQDASERPAPPPADYLSGTHWPPERLTGGKAWISCSYDYAADGDGRAVESLDFLALVDALTPCRDTGAPGSSVVRLRYHGSIDPGFTALVERVGEIAKRMAIDDRVLDMDSTGGQVEEAIRAGDSIAGSQWAIWVREGAVCHSACVLVLAAGDTRSIAGKVGIHRLIRDGSRATTRRELAEELHEVGALEAADRRGRSGDRPRQRVAAPERLREEIVDVVVRRVLDLRDLLDDDVALPVDLFLGELRLREDVGQKVQGERKMLVEDLRVVAGVFLAGERVQHAADRVDLLRDLRRRPPRRALEEQVLEEMRDPGLLGSLVARPVLDPDPHRDRAERG